MARPAENLEGLQFGKLTVISRNLDLLGTGHAYWNCKCNCGSPKIVLARANSLKSEHTRSCGCLIIETNSTHGLRKVPEYNIWRVMKDRCYKEGAAGYELYGARGIRMSNEWRDSFEAFYRDMGPRPSPEHSVDRKKNDRGYSKRNCRWATRIEQANNRRTNIFYEFDGETKTLAEWCRELRISYKQMYHKLKQCGMSFEDAADSIIKNKES